MKYWICTYSSTNDQGLHVGSVTKSEEEPIIEWENTEWMEISEKDYNDCLNPTPQYVIVDMFGKIVCEGSYMMCEWHMEKGQDARTFGGKIVLRKKHIENIINKAMKSIWWNTIQRFIEIEGGKFDNNSIKFVDGIIKKHLLPIMYQDTPETGLNKLYKIGFMTFDDTNIEQEQKPFVYDLGDFIRFRLTFGDKPINHDAILEINIKLL